VRLRLCYSPLAIVVVSTAVVAAMVCFAAVVASLVHKHEQAIPVGLTVSFVLAWFGGLFWPLYDFPSSMQEVGRVLMTTWSTSAIQDVILRERSPTRVSTELLVLVVYGLITYLIAVPLFRCRDEARSCRTLFITIISP
jgi:ABC-type multidrug transport system permease subunit